jgi:hypothetical protein
MGLEVAAPTAAARAPIDWRNVARRAGIAAAMAMILWFYAWTASSSGNRFRWHGPVWDHDFYLQLTNGFNQGHLYLNVKPRPELLALADPYDMAANDPYRLHDASLYKGRYYIYWGPAPVLTLYWPWLWITGENLPESFGVVVFSGAGLIMSWLLLFLILERARVRVSYPMKLFLTVALAFCGFVPHLLRRPLMYEVAISAGWFFLTAALYAWIRGILPDAANWRWLLAAGIAMGLGTASRLHFALPAAVLTVVTAAILARRGRTWRVAAWRPVIAFVAPLVICAIGLLWYNQARFDNPLEFGVTYQLSGITGKEGVRPTIGKTLADLYYFLLAPPRWRDSFPFVWLPRRPVFGRYDWMPRGEYVEEMAGLFSTTPVYLLGVFLPIVAIAFRRLFKDRGRIGGLMLSVWIVPAIVLAFLCPLGWATLRYSVDFAPLFLILSLAAALMLIQRIRRPLGRSVAWGVLIGSTLFGIAVNAAVSTIGFNNGLEEGQPDTYNHMARLLSERLHIGKACLGATRFKLKLAFNGQPGSEPAVLVRSGIGKFTNAVRLEYSAPGLYRMRWEQAGAAPRVGPEQPFRQGEAHWIAVSYSAGEGRVRVAVDDREVLSADQAAWFPATPSGVRFGPGVEVYDFLVRAAECRSVPRAAAGAMAGE